MGSLGSGMWPTCAKIHTVEDLVAYHEKALRRLEREVVDIWMPSFCDAEVDIGKCRLNGRWPQYGPIQDALKHAIDATRDARREFGKILEDHKRAMVARKQMSIYG